MLRIGGVGAERGHGRVPQVRRGIGRQGKHQAAVEIGIHAALDDLHGVGIQGGMAEGAGDAHHESAALQFDLQPQGEITPRNDIEPRVEDCPFRKGCPSDCNVLVQRNLKIGRATPAECPERLGHAPGGERAIHDPHNLRKKNFVPEGLPIKRRASQGEESVRDRDGAVLRRRERLPVSGLQQAGGFRSGNTAAPDIKRLVVIPALGVENLR
jgi:hypothetical protein